MAHPLVPHPPEHGHGCCARRSNSGQLRAQLGHIQFMTPNPTDAPNGFYGLGIAPKLLEVLEKLRFTTPTPIQAQSIPVALEGKDVMGIAQTGTGKTLAFGIPMIQRLAQTRGRGLIVLPTRELALQVQESLQRIGQHIGLKTVVLIGGAPIDRQIRELRANQIGRAHV